MRQRLSGDHKGFCEGKSRGRGHGNGAREVLQVMPLSQPIALVLAGTRRSCRKFAESDL